jgi:hypothetical protein
MKPIDFPEKNKIYTKPETMTDEECGSLHVFENEQLKISCWEFTPDEFLHAIFFRKIWLSVYMNVQPPVGLSAEFPFVKDADGHDQLPIAVINDVMIERKVNQFIIQYRAKEFTLPDLSTSIDFSFNSQMEVLLKDFINFFVGRNKDG